MKLGCVFIRNSDDYQIWSHRIVMFVINHIFFDVRDSCHDYPCESVFNFSKPTANLISADKMHYAYWSFSKNNYTIFWE